MKLCRKKFTNLKLYFKIAKILRAKKDFTERRSVDNLEAIKKPPPTRGDGTDWIIRNSCS